MTWPRRTWLWIIAGFVVLMILVAAIAGPGGAAGASVFSHGRSGWKGAASWLEQHATEVTPLDRALHTDGTLHSHNVLVAAFPARGFYKLDELAAVNGFLREGGTIVFAASCAPPGFAESQLAESLDLRLTHFEQDPPLLPWSWYRWARQSVILAPDGEWPGRPLEIPRPIWRIEAENEAQTLYRWPNGNPAVWTIERGRGTIVILPSAVFSNSYLGIGGNADLLESLRYSFDSEWSFDEVRHGFGEPGTRNSSEGIRAFDVLVLHLFLLFLACIFSLARQFGPSWRTTAISAGSTTTFLQSIAHLHQRFGHHREAARLLVERSLQFDPLLEPPINTEISASDTELLDLARSMARHSLHKEKP